MALYKKKCVPYYVHLMQRPQLSFSVRSGLLDWIRSTYKTQRHWGHGYEFWAVVMVVVPKELEINSRSDVSVPLLDGIVMRLTEEEQAFN